MSDRTEFSLAQVFTAVLKSAVRASSTTCSIRLAPLMARGVLRALACVALGLPAACTSDPVCPDGECPEQTADSSSDGTQNSTAAASSSAEPEVVPPSGCGDDSDCVELYPICDNGTCVACLDDSDCGDGRLCLTGALGQDAPRCVECSDDKSCGEGELCVHNECVLCDPASNAGCDEGHCTATPMHPADAGAPEGPACVACLDGAHCESGLCVEQSCALCNPADHRGCSPGRYCMVEQSASDTEHPQASCVECLDDTHCESGVCEANVCVPCLTDNNAGCPDTAPLCIEGGSDALTDDALTDDNAPSNGLPDAGLFQDAGQFSVDASVADGLNDADAAAAVPFATRRCVECTSSEHCPTSAAPYCVEHTCQACDPADHAGCSEDGLPVCAPVDPDSVAAPLTTGQQWQCAQCNVDDDCNGERCLNQTCVQCLDSSDCNSRHAPLCTAENSCEKCESDSDCSAFRDTPVCNSSTGACVECSGDEHCGGASNKNICDVTSSVCVECTESRFAHCPGGCVIVPGVDRYRCASETDDTEVKAECGRCVHDSDCETDSGYECVEFNDEERCLLRASDSVDAGGCPHATLTLFRAEDAEQGNYCAPEDGC